MKGFVPTPAPVVDLMVAKLFAGQRPRGDSTLLDPGCGEGEFIAGVLRACRRNGWSSPRIIGIELDPARARTARDRFSDEPHVTICERDYLAGDNGRFDFIIGNPPYVSIGSLSLKERERYRASFRSAVGRFDLYFLFFEQALRELRRGGTLVFVTPEKFLYVETARALRALLLGSKVEELAFLPEDTFPGRTTYPLVSTIRRMDDEEPHVTRVLNRDGSSLATRLEGEGSWLASTQVRRRTCNPGEQTLADCTLRISCGVATGADAVFVLQSAATDPQLRAFARPYLTGRDIAQDGSLTIRRTLLTPYDDDGALLPEKRLGALGEYLGRTANRSRLERRYCAARKPWYAFHDSFPYKDIRRPKLICKDITSVPVFVVDRKGDLVPGHSTYFVVPRAAEDLDVLAEWLNGHDAREWLVAHCQRAANGFLRMQSHVLKQLPIPPSIIARLVGNASSLTTRTAHA